MQQTGLVRREDGSFGGSIVALGSRGYLGKSGEGLLVASREKLGISEALVVSTIAEELGGILQESGKLIIAYTGLGRQCLPVTVTSFVKLDDELENVFGLWRCLAQNNTITRKGRPVCMLVYLK
jgi:hypothetical protein